MCCGVSGSQAEIDAMLKLTNKHRALHGWVHVTGRICPSLPSWHPQGCAAGVARSCIYPALLQGLLPAHVSTTASASAYVFLRILRPLYAQLAAAEVECHAGCDGQAVVKAVHH